MSNDVSLDDQLREVSELLRRFSLRSSHPRLRAIEQTLRGMIQIRNRMLALQPEDTCMDEVVMDVIKLLQLPTDHTDMVVTDDAGEPHKCPGD